MSYSISYYKENDDDMEEFWVGFKMHLRNLGKNCDEWSAHLNDLKSQRRYDDIKHAIRGYICITAREMLREASDYHYKIFMTNVKRWEKIDDTEEEILIYCRLPKPLRKEGNLLDIIVKNHLVGLFDRMRRLLGDEYISGVYSVDMTNLSSEKIIKQILK
jgi:hypothetical protein